MNSAMNAIDRISEVYFEYAEKERSEGTRKPKEESLIGKEDGEVIFRTMIPKEAAGSVIGSNGDNIKAMRDECNAKVFLENETYDMHQMVRIVGTPKVIQDVIPRLMDSYGEGMDPEALREWARVTSFEGGEKGGGKGSKGHDRGKGKKDKDSGKGYDKGYDRDNRGQEHHRDTRTASSHPGHRVDDKAGGRSRDLSSIGAATAQIMEFSKKISPERAEIPHAIHCELPNKRIGSLIGRKGETVNYVERTTGTKISVDDVPKEELPEFRSVSITGPLLSCYAAHLMLMKEYHDAEQREDEEQRARDSAASRGGGNVESKVLDLQKQLAELQQQLDSQKTGGSSGGGKGGRSKGKGSGTIGKHHSKR